jgi:predicted nicotinamide N-methyase
MEHAKAIFSNDSPLNWETELQKLQQSYQLKPVQIDINGYIINLVKVTNIDDLLERANSADEIPFWAELWPSSIGLARYILEHKTDFKDRSVLELGAGVGLAGIAAKLAGGQGVQSDFTIEALRFTQVNCLRNQVAATDLLLADWRNFPIDIGSFDWIIGADILYEKSLHSQLSNIFKQYLKPDGAVLLADPGRNYGKDFIRESNVTGWRLSQSSYPVCYEERTYNIDIYQLQGAGTG